VKFALWLMKRFAVDSSLAGDLAEEWRSGRSTVWLLRQTAVAVGTALRDGLWEHKVRTMGVILVGQFFGSVAALLLQEILWPLVDVLGNGFTALMVAVYGSIASWSAARLHRIQPLGAGLLYTTCMAAWGTVAGWEFYFGQYSSWSTTSIHLGPYYAAMIAGSLLGSRRASATPIPG
jgi:hypothetical protein